MRGPLKARHELIAPNQTQAKKPQAIILAAGRGSRIHSQVSEFPKCLLRVGGNTLLDHQLSSLFAAGIEDVSVVVGYHRDNVARACHGRVDIIDNKIWSDTNSLYSFWLAREWIKRDIVVLNCDVLADPRVLERLLSSEKSGFAYDSSSGDDDEHMKVEIVDGRLKSMSKSLDQSRVHGENIGILYFTRAHAQAMIHEANTAIDEGANKSWLATAVDSFVQKNTMMAVDVCDLPWIEIDYEEDLLRARQSIWPRIANAETYTRTQERVLASYAG